MKATFENSVSVLVNAYLNETLEHGNCHACAVGNIVAASCGFSYKKAKNDHVNFLWSHFDRYYVSDVNKVSWYNHVKYGNRIGNESIRQIESTGYNIDQLRMIEAAFESRDGYPDAMFNGLMAVVDVLADIHNIDLTAKESAKKLFVKP